jgi:hypothetical protein
MAGWGDDPELERMRMLIEQGWEVTDITEDGGAPGGPVDQVTLAKDGDETVCSSDHLAFHRYVEYLREERA